MYPASRMWGFLFAILLGSADAAPAPPVKIGLVASVTRRDGSESGSHLGRSVTLALEDINRAGGVLGRPLEVVYEDRQGTVSGSVVAATKLVNNPQVVAIIAAATSSSAIAMMPTLAQRRIPVLVGATHYALTHSNNSWVFRVRPSDEYFIRAMADFGVQSLGKRKWAIAYSLDASGIDARDRLVQELKARGVSPLAVEGVSSAENLAPAVEDIRASGADLVAICVASSLAAARFVKQLRESGVNAALIGSASAATESASKAAGEALHGAYLLSEFAQESSPRAAEFARRFRQRWGSEADRSASAFYDALQLLAAAIRKAGSTEPEAIRNALRGVRGHAGVAGTYSFDENGDGLRDINVLKNESGKLVFRKRITYEPR